MKKLVNIVLLVLLVIFCICPISRGQDNTAVLTAGITMIPKSFYGTWRVESSIIDANSPIFKKKSLDIWNLSRTSDVITLCNPFNGAKAEIIVEKVKAGNIVFNKTGKYGKKILTDKVELDIQNDKFIGVNTIELKTYEGGNLLKTETAKYKIKGEKIAGQVEIE